MVSSFMPPHLGGLETAAESMFQQYQAAGRQVRWVASRIPRTLPKQEHERLRVPCWNGLEEWLGVPWPIWGPQGIRAIQELVRWADVLHVQDCLYFSSAVTVWQACRLRKPVIVSQHIGFVSYQSLWLRNLELLAYHMMGAWVLRHVSHIVYCTPTAEEYVIALLRHSPANATLIPYGIDTNRFRPAADQERVGIRRTLGIPADKRLVLFTGRLVEKKGIDLFVDVSRARPEEHFLIVGDGPRRPAKTANLSWIPAVLQAEMPQIYQAADAFLLPSHSEGFPLSILEALATGLPVITSTGQTFAKQLHDDGACLVAERACQAFSEALDRLFGIPGLADNVGRRARDLTIQRWSLEAMGARYNALVEQLCSTSLPGQRVDPEAGGS